LTPHESSAVASERRGIPLIRQIAVGEPWRQPGFATLLMDQDRLGFAVRAARSA